MRPFSRSRRVGTLVRSLGLFAALGAAALLGAPVSQAQTLPVAFTFSGGGWGHGIGMSQYGADGMALAGATPSQIISFYYGGSQTTAVTLPTSIRIGMLQANNDPLTGGLLQQVLIQGEPYPGLAGSTGNLVVTGTLPSGVTGTGTLPGATTISLQPSAGGVAAYSGTTLLWGPTAPGTTLTVHYSDAGANALLAMSQNGRTLAHGNLQVDPVQDGATPLLRAVAQMSVNHYIDGIDEVPSSWPTAALQAQAVAARSYAVAKILQQGQNVGQAQWNGCNCAVFDDTRDQNYAGWAKESQPTWGAAWTGAVAATGTQVVTYNGQVVEALYSSSNGGYEASNATWGSAPLPYYPAQPDPWDVAGGSNPNESWSVTLPTSTVSAELAGTGVGTVTNIAVTATNSERAMTVVVTGTAGQATLSGATLQWILGLMSTKYAVSGVYAGMPAPVPTTCTGQVGACQTPLQAGAPVQAQGGQAPGLTPFGGVALPQGFTPALLPSSASAAR